MPSLMGTHHLVTLFFNIFIYLFLFFNLYDPPVHRSTPTRGNIHPSVPSLSLDRRYARDMLPVHRSTPTRGNIHPSVPYQPLGRRYARDMLPVHRSTPTQGNIHPSVPSPSLGRRDRKHIHIGLDIHTKVLPIYVNVLPISLRPRDGDGTPGCIFPRVGVDLCTGSARAFRPEHICGWGDSPIARGVGGKETVRLGVYAPVAYSHFDRTRHSH